MVAAASPRLVATDCPHGSRGAAATRRHGMSTSRPRRRRDSPRNVHVAAAASPGEKPLNAAVGPRRRPAFEYDPGSDTTAGRPSLNSSSTGFRSTESMRRCIARSKKFRFKLNPANALRSSSVGSASFGRSSFSTCEDDPRAHAPPRRVRSRRSARPDEGRRRRRRGAPDQADEARRRRRRPDHRRGGAADGRGRADLAAADGRARAVLAARRRGRQSETARL